MNENDSKNLNNADICGNNPTISQTSPAHWTKAPTSPMQPINNLKKIVSTNTFDGIALVLTLVFSYIFFKNLILLNFSIGLFVGYILIFALASVYIISKHKKFPLSAVFPGVIAIMTAFSYALHGGNHQMLSIVMLIFLSGVYCIELTGSNKNSNGSYFYLLDLIKCQILIPLMNFLVPIQSFIENKNAPRKGNSKKITAVFLGFICAVPVLFIVVPLLLSDAAFDSVLGTTVRKLANLFDDVFEYMFNEDVGFGVIAIIITMVFAPYIYSVMFSFRHGLAKNDNKDTSANYTKLRIVSTNVLCGFLGVISIVYVIYLLSQSAYFFSAFAGHLPGGMKITVTEYARQGFLEMTKIAGINLCIIAACVLFGKRENGKISAVVKWFSLFLCVFNLVMVATSISKILLYINKMGLTEKRIYVFVFDVMLIFVFLAIIARLFKEKFPYMRVIIAAACIAVTFLELVPLNDVIFMYNTEMYLSGKLRTIDVMEIESELYSPSKTMLESVLKLTKCDDSKVVKEAENVLYHAFYLKTDHTTNSILYENIQGNCISNIICNKYLQIHSDKFAKYQDEKKGKEAYDLYIKSTYSDYIDSEYYDYDNDYEDDYYEYDED